ncbi:MAG TPA: three-Cys-motif partner protein TcmP [Segetibacter sp.]|jgi:three-Cys-motif partner protein
MDNRFGGDWTEQKIQILETYAKQFLKVFKNKPNDKLLYFDGFAGSGSIEVEAENKSAPRLIEGAAMKILKIDQPRAFNMYYFVEKNKNLAKSLEERIKSSFAGKEVYVQAKDCNEKLKDLAKFLRSLKGKEFKVLGFIDPKGMQLEWSSLEILRGLSIDLWILNPTSGTNRLLVRRKEINEAWLKRLEIFLGMEEREILNHFYSKRTNLFGEIDTIKEEDPINRLHELYAGRIAGNIFKYVSNPKVLRNTAGSPLFHFFMATNSEVGLRIANSVVNPKLGF